MTAETTNCTTDTRKSTTDSSRPANFGVQSAQLVARVACVVVLLAVFAAEHCRAADDFLQLARQLAWAGNYGEAEEKYEGLAKSQPIASAVGLSQILAATGRNDEARALLQSAIKAQPDDLELRARLAELAWKQGDWGTARECLTPEVRQSPLGRWIQAELLRQSGELADAEREYRALVESYRAGEVKTPEHLIAVGRAIAMLARWNRANDDFRFLVSEFYPAMLEQFPGWWNAAYEAGLLYLEKFNQADAARQFEHALKLNPQAAEVHAAKAHLALQQYDVDAAQGAADRALAINRNLLSARLAKADLLMINFDVAGAADYLERCRELNPMDEGLLGRIAAAYVVLDRHRIEPAANRSARVEALTEEVLSRNPTAGEFYFALGTRLEERRRFDLAIHYFQRAQECLPQLIGPQASLGMLFMRLGQEHEAQLHLEEAFKADPFNVRVRNSLQVLEVLADYESLETEHFIIRFDPQKDRHLARYAAAHLESVFPELCQSLGYVPEEKSLIEIFHRARNTGGHSWFAARAVGLPYVGTVGACTGKMVAMTSPTEGNTRFNWARVLKHELVHVINLQQTNFNIPHWFTEALAVWHEGYPRSAEWNRMLSVRVPEGRLFDLGNINLGFIRPESTDDWQMAYCQAELYADYIRDRFGEDAFAKMLQAYADDFDTAEAIEHCFGIEVSEFERGYNAYLHRVVESLPSRNRAAEKSLAEVQAALAQAPDDLELRSELAQLLLDRGDSKGARLHAEKVLELDPRHPVAGYVMAQVHLSEGDLEAAIAILIESHRPSAPHTAATAMLASLKLEASDYHHAIELYRLLSHSEPTEVRWIKGLAKAALLAKQDEPLAEALAVLADWEPDDPLIRKKLAQMALNRENYQEAAYWARRTLDIDVLDVQVHAILAQSLRAIGELRESAEEYGVAVELAPGDARLQYSLADASWEAGQMGRARDAVEQLMRLEPDYPGAKELLEKLKQ